MRNYLSKFSFFFTSVFLKTKNMTSIRWVLSRLRQVMLKMCLLTIFFNVLVNKFFKFFLETNLFNIFVTICFSECFGKQMFSMFWFNIFVNNFCQNVLATKFFNVLIVKKKLFNLILPLFRYKQRAWKDAVSCAWRTSTAMPFSSLRMLSNAL